MPLVIPNGTDKAPPHLTYNLWVEYQVFKKTTIYLGTPRLINFMKSPLKLTRSYALFISAKQIKMVELKDL